MDVICLRSNGFVAFFMEYDIKASGFFYNPTVGAGSKPAFTVHQMPYRAYGFFEHTYVGAGSKPAQP
jgi:hypothetical protein